MSRTTNLVSVTKKRSITLPSGAVDTFTLFIVSSSSQRTSVTSTGGGKKEVQIKYVTLIFIIFNIWTSAEPSVLGNWDDEKFTRHRKHYPDNSNSNNSTCITTSSLQACPCPFSLSITFHFQLKRKQTSSQLL